MFWVIETKEQLQKIQCKDVFIHLILSNDRYHPILNEVIAIYLKPLESKDCKGYLIVLNHNEALSIDKKDVDDFIQKLNKIRIYNKKRFLYYFDSQNVEDINFITNKYEEVYNNLILDINKKHYSLYEINRIIPLSKHYEYCEELYNKNYNSINQKDIPLSFEFYNNQVTLLFWLIETEGLKIEPKYLYDKYEIPYPEFFIKDEIIYSEYNLFNITKRPSNSFNNINFLAIPKKDETRKSFIPKNDLFIEIDITAYHPTLLSKIVKYNIPENISIYDYLSEKYNIEREEAKNIMFKSIYGSNKKYDNIEFVNKIKNFRNELWNDFINDNEIFCPISKYRYDKNMIEDVNPSKLLNYYIQNLETSNNVNIAKKIIRKIISNKLKSRIVLYTFDSFLFDVVENELDVLKNIINETMNKEKLQYHIKKGNTYKLEE